MDKLAGIAKNLKLLSNFLLDMEIARMKPSQARDQFIEVIV